MTYQPEGIVNTLDEFEHIGVGRFYKAPGDPFAPTDAVVMVRSIRVWSDGVKDVELEDVDGFSTAYARLENLLGDHPDTGKPLFPEVDSPLN